MKTYRFTYLLLVSIILTLAVPVLAQHGGPVTDGYVNKLRMELEQTDRYIEQARERVKVTNSVQAQLYLDKAIMLQEQAWNQFREATNLGYRQAEILTRQAREKAKFALANGPFGSFSEQNDDAIQRKLERAEEMLQRSREELQGVQNRNLNQLFESAEENLLRAWEFYRNGQQRPSLKLCNQVENTLKKIINASNRMENGIGNLERHMENTREMLQNAQQSIAGCESENGLKYMEEARNALRLANELADQDKPDAAVKSLQRSRNMINNALRECNGNNALNERYERIKNEADRISELIPAEDNNSRALMEQVYEQLALAAEFMEQEDIVAATAALKAAQLTLNQVIKILNGDDGI